jgi:two-component system phosphate regulon sensor histidine kinase PhoR
MRQGRLLWRIYVYFLLAALAALGIATGNAVRALRHFHESHVADVLEMRGRLVARELDRFSLESDASEIDSICKDIGKLTGTRMTVILPGGKVIGDSEEDPSVMDNHATRPEIADAFRGQTGTSVRYSDTLRQRLKYAAIPVMRDGTIVAAVRMSQPIADVRWTQRSISNQLLVGGLIAAVLFALIALYLSRRTTRPLENMRQVAQRLAKGDLSARATVSTDNEIGVLAQALNDMATQLGDRMNTIARQNIEQDAVLECMVEGVLAVDTEGRTLYLNEALCQLLDINPEQARGRSMQEIIRHHEVQDFVAATLTNDGPSEAEVLIRGVPERHLQLHGTPLVEPNGDRIGGLVVMNDISRLKRLERVRSDFVANVSHELKTPITALKGCVETLTGDAPLKPEDTTRFTSMMDRHVSRLEAIVEDLLSLSRIEFETSNGQVERNPATISNVLQTVIQRLTKAAESKNITLDLKCSEELSAPINTSLIEQAVANLVDNAIKYSGDNTYINLTALQKGNQVIIAVSDQGPGIEQSHLPRIFERFYRLDTARSRAMGGTGLGLSIVKHIALAHQGNVTVESTVGHGTTFKLHLPKSLEYAYLEA